MSGRGVAARWRELGAGVYARRYEFVDQEIGLVVGDGAALLIDTRTTLGQAAELRSDVRAITAAPIDIVVNTHGHWDHCFGNAGFRGAAFWSQRGAVRFIERTAEETRRRLMGEFPDLAGELAGAELLMPDHPVDRVAFVDVGGRRLRLAFHGRGHTDHDLVVTVPDAGVTFAGDLVEEGAAPSFSDSYPLDWPVTLDALLAAAPAGPIVPGHGGIVDRAFVERQRAEIAQLAGAARRIQGEAGPPESTLADVPFSPAAAGEGLGRALAQLRGELD